MFRVAVVIAVLFVLLSVPDPAAAGETVAVVNNIPITRVSYDRNWPVFLESKGILRETPEDGATGELEREYVDFLIGKERLYQEAVRHGYEADEESVEREYARVCRPFRSEADIRETLRG